MRFTQMLRALFSVPADNPELTRSQLMALGRQIPLLYFILVVNTIAICITFFHRTPDWIGLYFPGLLCAISTFRAIQWWKKRHDSIPHDVTVLLLRKTVRMTVLFGMAYTAWALQLYQYGDAYARAHVAFYMSITVIGCIFCLLHLRPAALLLTGIVVGPWTVFFCLSGQPVFIAIAANLVLVSMAMIVILFINYRDFANLIESKKQLVAQQLATQRLSDENFRVASFDSLTKLPNRRSFFSSLDALLSEAEIDGTSFVVGLVDLDGFKQVNDAYGHSIGDLVLAEAARRLQAAASPYIQVSRLGGDEFGLLVKRSLTQSAVTKLGRDFCDALRGDVLVRDITVGLMGSAGFAIFPDAGATGQQLFERADYALYHAKKHSVGHAAIFSADHETQIRRSSLIEQELRIAVAKDQLSLALQPVVDMTSGETIGFEALARWNSPTLGPIQPDDFICVAERSDLINSLTEALLKKALQALKLWPEELYVSFNLSTRDIASVEPIKRIIDIIDKSGVSPQRIEFEITETAVMPDFQQAHRSLTALRKLGARIALDDFGSGYSSLSYVHRLPLDKIKVDRSFIADIAVDETCRNIVSTIVNMCLQLRVDCVIEGIETEVQKATMLALGCKLGQGYLFAKPMSETDVQLYLVEQAKLYGNRSTGPVYESYTNVRTIGLEPTCSNRVSSVNSVFSRSKQ